MTNFHFGQEKTSATTGSISFLQEHEQMGFNQGFPPNMDYAAPTSGNMSILNFDDLWQMEKWKSVMRACCELAAIYNLSRGFTN